MNGFILDRLNGLSKVDVFVKCLRLVLVYKLSEHQNKQRFIINRMQCSLSREYSGMDQATFVQGNL